VISDPFNLDRFSDAQYPIFSQVKRELSEGRKQTHWMWFVFPQLRLLGRSQTAQYFGITSLAEARAYMQHSLLGQRLIDCTKLVNSIESRSAYEIFDSPDDMKSDRLKTHIEWAHQQQALERVDEYLRSLLEEDWLHKGES
jgi:uncharacterized protein (DUF1810 family)